MQPSLQSIVFGLRGRQLQLRNVITLGSLLLCAACSTTRVQRDPPRPTAPSVSRPEPATSSLDLPAELDTAPVTVATPTPAAEVPATAPVAELSTTSESEPATEPEVERPSEGTATETSKDASLPDDADKTDEIRVLLERYYADFGGRDWTSFEGRFWPGATIVAIRQPPSGGPERVVSTPIADYTEEMRKQGDAGDRIEFAIATATIERDGVVALARVAYSARTSAQSEPQPWRGSDVFLLMSHENSWRIASLAFGTPDRGQ